MSRFVAVHFRALPLEAVFANGPPPSGVKTTEASEEQAVDHVMLPPCAVRETVRGRAVVVAVSAAALARGVRPGMTEAEGRATFAELAVREREPAVELVRLEHAAELLFAYGPEVEVCPPSVLFVEIGRSRRVLRRRFGHAREEEMLQALVAEMASFGHEVTAVLADDLDTARTLAEQLSGEALERVRSPAPEGARRRKKSDSASKRRSPRAEKSAPSTPEPFAPVRVVAPGRARAALASLPTCALAWTALREDPDRHLELEMQGVCEALRHLGIRKVGQLNRMGAEELGARFGEAGARMAARAVGGVTRPLTPYTPAERLEEHFELDAVTEDLEPILFVLRRLLHRLERRMEARQCAAGALTLDFAVEPGLERTLELEAARPRSSKRREVMRIVLARPTRSAETAFAVARERIGGSLPGGVLALRVVAESPERDRGAQLDLFSRRAQKTEAMAELVGRLSAALGASAVFTPKIEDTHRPERAWTPSPFSVDLALAPPRPAATRSAPAAVPSVVAAKAGTETVLPEVDAQLSVIAPVPMVDPETSGTAEAPWPKPRVRRPEDEPPAPLPPRPLEVFATPERATFMDNRRVLAWRGRRLPIISVSGREHLRTEWWRPSEPLARDYHRVETQDGRELWVFVTPAGEAFVHGVFD